MKTEFWKDKTILITGGTSGLGKALTLNLLDKVKAITVVARSKEGLGALPDHPNLTKIQADVSNKEDIFRISSITYQNMKSVDILVNNASYLGESPLKPLLDSECEDFEKVLQTNLLGPFRLTKVFLPAMLHNSSGLIVNISSDAGRNAYSHWGAYGTSKAAVDHISSIWQEEVRGSGVHFLSLDPQDMHTPMHLAAIPEANVDELKQPEIAAEQLISLIESNKFEDVKGVLK